MRGTIPITSPPARASVSVEEYMALLTLRAAVRRTVEPDSFWQGYIRSDRGDEAVYQHIRELLAECDSAIEAVRRR